MDIIEAFEKLDTLEEDYLLEMAYKRVDAIDRCFNLGKKFTQHFNTIAKLGKEDVDFKHHCQELQSWYDAVRVIKLKESNKTITRSQLWDWFFTAGQGVEDVILSQFIDLYEDFYLELSRGDRKVIDIMEELL